LLASAGPRRPVGPRWLFVGRDDSVSLPNELDSREGLPGWTQIDVPAGGWLLTDDHFPAELAWAKTAREWRSLCSDRP
jgi:hypothetical protein